MAARRPTIAMLPDGLAESLNEGRVPAELQSSPIDYNFSLSDEATIEVKSQGERWELFDPLTHHRFALQRMPEGIELRLWDNWYDYPGSYWQPERLAGVDEGEPLPMIYAFHVLLGHHGLFSLTPIWLLSLVGCVLWCRRGDPAQRAIALATIIITMVVVGFYLTRPLIDRNYGGGTCCLRWLIWLTPLWLPSWRARSASSPPSGTRPPLTNAGVGSRPRRTRTRAPSPTRILRGCVRTSRRWHSSRVALACLPAIGTSSQGSL